MRTLLAIPTLCCSLALLASTGCDLESKSVGDPDPMASDSGEEEGSDSDSGTTTDGEGEDPVAACIAANLPADGHGWESDGGECPQPPDGPPVECPDPIDVLEQECIDAGTTCDHETLITRDAAVCIATELGLAAGVRPWVNSLHYHYAVDRPVWVITNTTSAMECMEEGEDLVLDAETGELLLETNWMAVC